MNKLWYYIPAVLVGALAGYAYWHFYACDHGCTITSVWWRSSLYGAVMGYLTIGLVLPEKKG
ncbi:MAG: hypothetical protein KDB88_07110 [Flavobacteriales bacterium]|nr:hypothetical protein [Flavobacteriales bacterium]MCB0794491.1 hypothetical protein [Flavobacteriales bacterium]